MKPGIYRNAMLGALAADALAMPVHWYYDTNALDRDYGRLDGYAAPKNPHPDSILWRSRYHPRNERGDILREQAQYWGQRGIHYHQFLKSGENTINFKLATELHCMVLQRGAYDVAAWADRYVDCMLTDGWHRDTYLEEYHRAFFENYASGKAPIDCGIDDIHIGGLSQVPALLAAIAEIGITELDAQLEIVETHTQLTHKNRHASEAAATLTRTLHGLASGESLARLCESIGYLEGMTRPFPTWAAFPDRVVVGRHLSPACYLPESFQASLYLAWKYQDDFSAGILANAHCGGDNCHRGAVVGSILGAANAIPKQWLTGLIAYEAIAAKGLPT
jgi:ADP-ribosylglycohydrolase